MPNVQEQVVSSDDTLKMKMAMGRKLEASRLAERPVSKQVTKEPELEIDENGKLNGFMMVKGKAR